MAALVNSRVISPEPADYVVPEFPSLYWPFPINGPQSRFLYHTSDIWRFTLFWTLIFYAALHGATALYAVMCQLFGNVGGRGSSWKRWRAEKVGSRSDSACGPGHGKAKSSLWRVIWIIPVAFAVIGGIEAVVAGSIVGALLGAIYNAGYFKMSTWIPFVWALINSLIIILSSFAIQGGL